VQYIKGSAQAGEMSRRSAIHTVGAAAYFPFRYEEDVGETAIEDLCRVRSRRSARGHPASAAGGVAAGRDRRRHGTCTLRWFNLPYGAKAYSSARP